MGVGVGVGGKLKEDNVQVIEDLENKRVKRKETPEFKISSVKVI